MKKFIWPLILFSATAFGQQINPTTQITWPRITVTSGVPAQSCTSANYGQPYQVTGVTPNQYGSCGSDGWAIRGSSSSGGPSAPAFSVQVANSAVTGLISDSGITINTTTHTLSAPRFLGSSLWLPASFSNCTATNLPVYPFNNGCDQIAVTYPNQNIDTNTRLTYTASYGPSAPIVDGISAEGNFTHWGQAQRIEFNDAGGKEPQFLTGNCDGIGDCIPHAEYFGSHGGAAYGSDQGFQHFYLYTGEINSAAGTVAAGFTQTTLSLNSVSCGTGGHKPQAMNCNPSIGSWFSDMASTTSTTYTTLSGSGTFSCNGTSLSWVRYLTTTGGLPNTGTRHCAYILGAPTAVVPPDGTTIDAPVSISLTAQGTSQQLVNGFACAIGSNFVEPTTISGVSGNNFTATLSRVNTNIMFWQNTTDLTDPYVCARFSFDNDKNSRGGEPESFAYIGSPDGTTLIYGREAFGFVGTNPLPANATPGSSIGGGITVAPSAWIVRQNGTSNSDGSMSYGSYQLAVNNVPWTTGDPVVDPDYPTQSTQGMYFDMGCTSIIGSCQGIAMAPEGAGFSGPLNADYVAENGNQTTMYRNGSFVSTGLAEPSAFVLGGTLGAGTGGFGDYFHAVYSPANNGFSISNHWPGQTSYNIWSDPWGQFSLQSGQFIFGNATVFAGQGDFMVDLAHHGYTFEYSGSCGTGIWSEAGATVDIGDCTRPDSNGTLKAANLFASGLGSSTSPICTTTGGQLTNSGCSSSSGISGLTAGFIPLAGSATTITANSHCDDGVTTASTLTCAELTEITANTNGDFGLTVNNTNTGSAADSYIRLSTNNNLSTTTGIYSLASGRSPSGVVYPLSTYFGAANGQTNGMVFNTETTAPVVFASDNTGAFAVDSSSKMTLASGEVMGWSSGAVTPASHTPDTGFSRDSAGVMDVGNGTAGNTSGTLKAATGTFGTAVTVGGNNVCQSTGTNCPNLGPSYYWTLQPGLFSNTTVLGAIYRVSAASTFTALTMHSEGTSSCTTTPTINLLDLGTSPTTAYGSATTVTGFSPGVIPLSAVSQITGTFTVASGHYIAIGFSTGTCATYPTFDATLN